MKRLSRLAAVTIVVSLVTPWLGWAQEKDKKEERKAEVQVWAIRATTKNKDISPQLKGLADKLKKQFKFTGFKLERREKGVSEIGKSFTAQLIGGYHATVTPQKYEGKQVTLKVEILKEKDKDKISVYSTTFTVDAEAFQLIGGQALEGGDVLIIAVSAK